MSKTVVENTGPILMAPLCAIGLVIKLIDVAHPRL
jgi:hypothetical protein